MKSLVLILAGLLVSIPALADNIYVAPVRGVKVSSSEAEALTELIKVHIQDYPNHRVVGSEGDADYYLKTKLLKFDRYTLSMSKWKGSTKIVSNQWKAESKGELEAISEKAVGVILGASESEKKSNKNKSSLGEKAKEKQQRQSFERVQANKQVLLSFGPAYFGNLNTADSGLAFLLGYFWNIDDRFDLGIKSDFSISTTHSDANMLSLKIVTNYFPIVGDISPYIGLGFGYGYGSAHDGSG